MIFDAQFPRDVVWNQRKTALLTAIFGAVPLTLGNKIRRLVYRSLLGQIEEGVNIGTGVQLAGAKGIFFREEISSREQQPFKLLGKFQEPHYFTLAIET